MEFLSSSETLVSLFVGVIALVGSIKWGWDKLNIKLNSKVYEQENSGLDKCPAKRFLTLFEAHGVRSSQIPNFFGHGLSIANCSSPENLLNVITDEMLQSASELFAVNLNWLYGTSKEVYNIHQFYKSPNDCIKFVEDIQRSDNELSGYALRPDKLNTTSYNSAIVITEVIGHINDRPINRIHIWGGWVDSYWKCRGYYAACASIAMNSNIWLLGKISKHEWLSEFSSGYVLPKYNFDFEELELEGRKTWYVDEFLEVPEKYLEGVAPEQNNFGTSAAINLWLRLEAKGHMCIDKYSNREQIRESFLSYKV